MNRSTARPRVVHAAARALTDLGVRADRAHALVAGVLADHDEPGRHYHDVVHLAEMLEELDRLVAVSGGGGSRAGSAGGAHVPPCVVAAVLYHDVVQDPTRDDDEDRSARRAAADLDGLVAADAVEEISRLVRMTAGHEADTREHDEALLHDADLWILAAPPARHREYVAQVRREYGHLDDDAWRRGRAAVLARLDERMAATGYLVGPPSDRARRTRAARANIAAERAGLLA